MLWRSSFNLPRFWNRDRECDRDLTKINGGREDALSNAKPIFRLQSLTKATGGKGIAGFRLLCWPRSKGIGLSSNANRMANRSIR